VLPVVVVLPGQDKSSELVILGLNVGWVRRKNPEENGEEAEVTYHEYLSSVSESDEQVSSPGDMKRSAMQVLLPTALVRNM